MRRRNQAEISLLGKRSENEGNLFSFHVRLLFFFFTFFSGLTQCLITVVRHLNKLKFILPIFYKLFISTDTVEFQVAISCAIPCAPLMPFLPPLPSVLFVCARRKPLELEAVFVRSIPFTTRFTPTIDKSFARCQTRRRTLPFFLSFCLLCSLPRVISHYFFFFFYGCNQKLVSASFVSEALLTVEACIFYLCTPHFRNFVIGS